MGKGGRRKKKRFIDKKNAITFSLVHRSQRDPLTYEDASPLVLKTIGVGENVRDSVESSVSGWSFPQFAKAESVVQEPNSYEEYDYSQHLMPMGSKSGVYVTADGRVQEEVPDLVFGSIKEDDVGYMTNMILEEVSTEDMDPEILEAIENADEFEELMDNFVAIANNSDSDVINDPSLLYHNEGDVEGMYGEDFDDEYSIDDEFDQLDMDFAINFDFSIDEDFDKIQYAAPVQPTKVSKERELLTLQFEREMEQDSYDWDNSDEPPVQPMSMLVNQVLDDFLEYRVDQPYKQSAQTLRNMTEEQIEEYFQDSSSEELIRMEIKAKPVWDCESILSTYTNTENHPKLIETPYLDSTTKIKVNKRGFPRQVEEYNRRMDLEEQHNMKDADNAGKKRDKNETPEERAERKKLLKQQKKERRVIKKLTKEEFKNEHLKQKDEIARPWSSKTVIKY